MYTGSKDKSEMLNAQFKSVITKLKKCITPSISGNKYSVIDKLNISLNGVTKLLQNINASKTSGPDHILVDYSESCPMRFPQCFIPYFCSPSMMA